MRARATEVRQWQEDHDHHLFYGAAGRSAVRAAWQSAFAAERASYGEEEFASALLDLMKAFETVPHAKLIELARQHDYPLETLRLALAAYRLPRILCVDGIASQLTAASRGITAGSGHATTELRLLLLGLVEQLADCIRQSNNQLQASVYVDDVCVEAAGNRADGSAARDVASAVEMVKHYFDELGMSLSTVKSKAVGSTRKVANDLAKQAGGGSVLRPARVGKLLGTGSNGGSRRCVAVIAKRVRQYALKVPRILSLRKRASTRTMPRAHARCLPWATVPARLGSLTPCSWP